MSLLKQLLLSVTAIILVIVVGTLAFSIDSARSYLQTQVHSESENAATSLALTLSQPGNQDPVIRELMLMALFDTGRFQEVVFTDTDGELLFERRRDPSDLHSTPQWFRKLLPLQTEMAVRDVADGWKQVGTLGIMGNTSYAYESLWRNALGQLVLVLAAGLLWALIATLTVRWLRRVLNEQVAGQVRAIAQDGEAPPPAHGLRELNSLVREITQVRQRVRANVVEMDAQIELLKLELNQDPVTGLANRKYFVNEFRRLLQDDSARPGHVMMMRIRDLGAINAANSRQEADNWLRQVALAVQAWAQGAGAGVQVARLNGSDFAVLIPGAHGPQGMRLAQELGARLRDMRLALPDGQYSRWAFSLTDYAPGDDAGMAMGLLDYGLMRAESAGHTDVEYLPKDESLSSHAAASEGAWRDLLRQALDEDNLHLHVSEVSYANEAGGASRRSDAFLQLRDGSEWLSGSLFMPVAVRLNLSAEFDLRAIDLAIEWIRTNTRDLVVRVSLASLLQPRFWPGLRQRLDALVHEPAISRHLVFELDAHGLNANPEQVKQFCLAANEASARVGIRRMDAEPSALSALDQAPVDYVRLTGPLIDSAAQGVGGAELVRAIASTARHLGIKVYANPPSSDEARKLLLGHDVNVALR